MYKSIDVIFTPVNDKKLSEVLIRQTQTFNFCLVEKLITELTQL